MKYFRRQIIENLHVIVIFNRLFDGYHVTAIDRCLNRLNNTGRFVRRGLSEL